MPSILEWTPSSRLAVLVYSRPGEGKTFGAGTFPRPNYFDFDKGIATLAGAEFVKRHGWRDIQYEQFTEVNVAKSGVIQKANAFDDACRYFDAWMSPKGTWKGKSCSPEMFDTWVIDSGTTLSELALNKAIVLLGDKSFAAASNTHQQALTHGMVFPKIQDYGSERSLVEQFVQMILDSGKNVVLLCHEKEVTNSQGSVTQIVPLLTGKGVQAVALKFDEVYRLISRRKGTELERTLVTVTDTIAMAKSRYGIPTGTPWAYDNIIKAIETTLNTRSKHHANDPA